MEKSAVAIKILKRELINSGLIVLGILSAGMGINGFLLPWH